MSVYENLDFERGMDPKRSLNIGRNTPSAKHKRMMTRYAKMDKGFQEDWGDRIDGFHGEKSFIRWDKNGALKPNDRIHMKASSIIRPVLTKWFKKNHPNFRILNFRQEATGPYTKSNFLTIKYIGD